MFNIPGLGELWTLLGAVVLAIGAVLGIFHAGKRRAREEQEIDDLKHGADIRRRADKAEKRHEADMGQLPDDPDERRGALTKRMRRKNRLRD